MKPKPAAGDIPDHTKSFDPASAASRRRFFIERAMRMRTRGSGSDLARLLEHPLNDPIDLAFLDGIPAMLIGAHAAAAFAPPRMTQDVDIIVPLDHYEVAEARMRADGFRKLQELVFFGSRLGLRGEAWAKAGGDAKDLITSDQVWLREAFDRPPVLRADEMRVIPRDYLILMKLDSARGIDQGDLTRILGRMSPDEVERTARVVARHSDDEHMVDDLRQLAEIGRWEYDADSVRGEDQERSGGDRSPRE